MNRSTEGARAQARAADTTLAELYGAGCYILEIIRIGRPGDELAPDVEAQSAEWNARVDSLRERWDQQYGELRQVEDLAAHGTWMISMLEETYDEILVLYNDDSPDEATAPPSVRAGAFGSRCSAIAARFGEEHPGWAALRAEVADAEERMLSEGIDMEALNDIVSRFHAARDLAGQLELWKEHVDDVVYRSDHDDPVAELVEAERQMHRLSGLLDALLDIEL